MRVVLSVIVVDVRRADALLHAVERRLNALVHVRVAQVEAVPQVKVRDAEKMAQPFGIEIRLGMFFEQNLNAAIAREQHQVLERREGRVEFALVIFFAADARC